MPDTLAFLLLVALLVGVIGMCVGAALLAIAAWRWVCGAARWAVSAVRTGRRTARRREQLVQQLVVKKAEYLACHSLACGHMETVHVPDSQGQLVCEACGIPAVR